MKLTFRSLAILSALVFFSLALTWMFAPNVMLSPWDVDFSYGKKRWAFARPALVTGFVVTCLTLATLGVFELATGHAGFGISVAVLIEVALALAFLYVARANKAGH